MKVFTLIKTDTTEPDWIDVRIFKTIEDAFRVARMVDGFNDYEIKELKEVGMIEWSSQDAESIGTLNMTMHLIEGELK